jgi:hypothetical protein
MKGLEMSIEWRTVQLFLSEDGVAEVELDADNPTKLRCTCKRFERASSCKHIAFVRKSMDENEGHFLIQIPQDVPDDEAIEAMREYDSFRNFVIKHCKVEVLD